MQRVEFAIILSKEKANIDRISTGKCRAFDIILSPVRDRFPSSTHRACRAPGNSSLVRSQDRRAIAAVRPSARTLDRFVGWVSWTPGSEAPKLDIQLAYFGRMAYRWRCWFLIASRLFDEKMF